MKVMKVKLCEVITLECQLCFRNNKIREFDALERQTMGVNKYASTFPMASCNKKWKIRNCFCKYAIEENQVA